MARSKKRAEWKTVGPVGVMFEHEVFEEQYEGIIEIRPHRVSVSAVFDSALKTLTDKGYQIAKISDGWLRAYAGAPKRRRKTE